jgi:phosphotriesterase-related protein
VLREEGVDLGRVVIGHSNESTDLDYLEALIDNGSYIGFDRCGLHLVAGLEDQLDTLAELCRRGYANRIVLSHDRSCQSDWFTEEQVTGRVPWWTYSYIDRGVLPGVRARGVTDEQIEQMMIRNPRAIFAAGREEPTTASAIAAERT